MKQIKLIHLGLGNVGKELAKQIFTQQEYLKQVYQVDLQYTACFSSSHGIVGAPFLKEEDVFSFPSNSGSNVLPEQIVAKADTKTILIDTTSSEETVPLFKTVLSQGGNVVMANKKPFSSDFKVFETIAIKYLGHVYFETTVGAGLPILRPLTHIVDTGDTVTSIEGCLSGTLGFICSQLEEGKMYSEAVHLAKEMGYTEPDSRDDLSGMDVARKALILARVSGKKVEMDSIALKPLFNQKLASLPVETFMNELSQDNEYYKSLFNEAKKENKTYRYIASITEKKITVGLQKVDKNSALGSLKGPENKIAIYSKRYNQYPLVIQGPGAGAAVTATGVFSDILSVVTPQI